MPPAQRRAGAPKRKVAPWKHTERDRGWMRRKARVAERAKEKA